MEDVQIPADLQSVLPPPFANWRATYFRDWLVMVSPDHEPLIAQEVGGKWVVIKIDWSKPIEGMKIYQPIMSFSAGAAY